MQAKTFLLGMVAGAAVTLAVTRWTGMPEPAQQRAQPSGIRRITEGATLGPGNEPQAESAQPAGTASASPVAGSSHVVDEPAAPQQSSASLPASPPPSGEPPAIPVAAIAPLFSDVLNPPHRGVVQPVVQLHRKLEAEPEDDAWSPAMETTLREYLQRQPGFDRIEIMVLDCRTTVCEIQAAGFLSDSNPQLPPHLQIFNVYQAATINIEKQPWASELTHAGTTFGSRDERVLFVTQLVRER